MVFALSAMFAGIAGGLQALNIEAGNYVLFEVKLSTDAVLFAYIGGVNAFLGPVLGAPSSPSCRRRSPTSRGPGCCTRASCSCW